MMAVHVHLLCRNFGANKLHNSSLQKILHVHQLFELILIEMKWFLNCLACHDETTQTCKYAEQENEESEENDDTYIAVTIHTSLTFNIIREPVVQFFVFSECIGLITSATMSTSYHET
jgi:hypothetical protein